MVRRIDAHMHFWMLARGDYGWITPDLLQLYRDFDAAEAAPLLAACGIDATILVQAAPTLAETRFLLARAAAFESVAGVVGWVDMAAPDAAATIADLARNKLLVGIRPMIHDIADDDWMLSPALAPAWRAVIEHDLAFDFLVRPRHLPAVRQVLDRHPDLRAVIDHGAKPEIASGRIDDWATAMAGLARDTRVHCKLSGLVTEAGADWTVDRLQPFVAQLVESFGPDRLIWGSDWPVVMMASGYERWSKAADACLAAAGLDGAAVAAVRGGTAERFYRLAPDRGRA